MEQVRREGGTAKRMERGHIAQYSIEDRGGACNSKGRLLDKEVDRVGDENGKGKMEESENID